MAAACKCRAGCRYCYPQQNRASQDIARVTQREFDGGSKKRNNSRSKQLNTLVPGGPSDDKNRIVAPIQNIQRGWPHQKNNTESSMRESMFPAITIHAGLDQVVVQFT